MSSKCVSIIAGVAVGLLALGTAEGKKAAAPPGPPPPATNLPQAKPGPLKVFILAGQSNMEGQGVIKGSRPGTLETLAKDPASAARYKQLLGQGGQWAVRNDVWITYNSSRGGLTAGGYAARGCIGPELGIGWVLGDYLKNQVLLIKFGWGGTSLAGNWRPPSSGGEVGGCYKQMIAGVKEQLAGLKTDFPHYDGKGYEVAGFGWFQGWQDGCSGNMAAEYEQNLANFIRDVRKDLGAPKLPFVIGGSGFAGWNQKIDRRLKIIQAQQAVAQKAEFKDTVRYVETRNFFRPPEVSPHKMGFHFCGNAETYWLTGEGMGRALVELLGGPKAPPNATGPAAQK